AARRAKLSGWNGAASSSPSGRTGWASTPGAPRGACPACWGRPPSPGGGTTAPSSAPAGSRSAALEPAASPPPRAGVLAPEATPGGQGARAGFFGLPGGGRPDTSLERLTEIFHLA